MTYDKKEAETLALKWLRREMRAFIKKLNTDKRLGWAKLSPPRIK